MGRKTYNKRTKQTSQSSVSMCTAEPCDNFTSKFEIITVKTSNIPLPCLLTYHVIARVKFTRYNSECEAKHNTLGISIFVRFMCKLQSKEILIWE